MLVARLLVLTVLIAGCAQVASTPANSSTPSPTTTASPSPSPAAGRYAVMVHTAGAGEPYVVQLVSANAQGGPSVRPTTRSAKLYYFPPGACPPGAMCIGAQTAAYTLPEISISRTRVYFLDGDTQVKSLSPDGSVETVMNIGAPANTQVVFAVSPDDSRIVISAITLATSNVPDSINDVMYAEDLGTARNRIDIYSSTTLAEWPIAWHGDDLIVATGPRENIASFDGPYGAAGYKVVQVATGSTIATLDCAQGLVSPTGTACATGFCGTASTCGPGTLWKEEWDGSKVNFALPPGAPPRILLAFGRGVNLSPDGTRIAAYEDSGAPGYTDETLLVSDGLVSPLTPAGSPQGWLDNTHVVVSTGMSAWIADIEHGTLSQMTNLQAIPQQGTPSFFGVLPTNLT